MEVRGASRSDLSPPISIVRPSPMEVRPYSHRGLLAAARSSSHGFNVQVEAASEPGLHGPVYSEPRAAAAAVLSASRGGGEMSSFSPYVIAQRAASSGGSLPVVPAAGQALGRQHARGVSIGAAPASSAGPSPLHSLFREARSAPTKADRKRKQQQAAAPGLKQQRQHKSDDSHSAGDNTPAFEHAFSRRTISQNTAPGAFGSFTTSMHAGSAYGADRRFHAGRPLHSWASQLQEAAQRHAALASNRRPAARHRYRGVTKSHDGTHYVAYVTCMGMSTFAGRYDSEVEAAAAHDRALLQVLGPSAASHLNFPPSQQGGDVGHLWATGAPHSKADQPAEDGRGRSLHQHATMKRPASPRHAGARVETGGPPPGSVGKRGSGSSMPSEFQKSSQYRGVSWNKKDKKWQSMIFSKGKAMWLGYFKLEEDAARAYDRAAHRERGAKAKLNFPDSVDTTARQTAST